MPTIAQAKAKTYDKLVRDRKGRAALKNRREETRANMTDSERIRYDVAHRHTWAPDGPRNNLANPCAADVDGFPCGHDYFAVLHAIARN